MALFTPSVLVQQPQTTSLIPVNSKQWRTGICDCFDQCHVCCFAAWCFPVFACNTAHEFGECFCLPVLDNRYGIQGDLTSDCLYSTFCNVCSWCQIAQEIKRRRASCVIVNTQATIFPPPPVVTATHVSALPSQTTMTTQSAS